MAALEAAGSAGGVGGDKGDKGDKEKGDKEKSEKEKGDKGGTGGGAPLGKVEELLLVLKYGGVLTHAGRKQAEVLGTHFRAAMYPRCGGCGEVWGVGRYGVWGDV